MQQQKQQQLVDILVDVQPSYAACCVWIMVVVVTCVELYFLACSPPPQLPAQRFSLL